MGDERALLAAVLADPRDDLPRLVLADWWQERGNAERAEFVRVQCELARTLEAIVGEAGDAYPNGLFLDLRRRERELWTRRLDDGYAQGYHWFTRPLGFSVALTEYDRGALTSPFALVRRGFVAEVRATLADLFGGECGRCEGLGECSVEDFDGRICHRGECPRCSGTGRTPGAAADLWGCQPVTSVTLSDVRPHRLMNATGRMRYGYEVRDDNARDGWQLPAELFRHLPQGDFFVNDYRRWWWEEADAVKAVSTAAVRLGRKLAGLPPLEMSHDPH